MVIVYCFGVAVFVVAGRLVYIALFSALELTHLAHVACDSRGSSDCSFLERVLNIHPGLLLAVVCEELWASFLLVIW